jgi:two-component system cell cycle sensor histidine kinase/response regulator CckA
MPRRRPEMRWAQMRKVRPLGRVPERFLGLLAPRKPLPDDQALTARLLNGTILASFPILLSAVGVRLALGIGLTETANLTIIVFAAVCFLAGLILRSGRVYLSGYVLMFALWAAGTLISWRYFGIRDASAVIPLYAVVIAFAILPRQAGMVLTALNIGSVWLLVALELQGLRKPEIAGAPDTGLTATAVVVLLSVLAFVFGEILRRAVRDTVASQQALSKSEKELASILYRTPDIIYRLDTEGRITYVNEAVRRYGYDPAKMIGTHLLDYVHPEDYSVALHRLNERRTGERRTQALEIRLLTVHGGEKVAEYTAVPIVREPVFLLQAEGLYENGTGPERHVGTQGIARDITDRKRTEEALRRSEEKYSKAFHTAPVGVAVTTLDGGRYLDVNEEYERIFDYPPHELVGRSALDIGVWASLEERDYVLSLLRRGEPVKDREGQGRTRNGELRTLRYSMQLMDVGDTACLITTTVDITRRKRAEEALQKSEEKYSKVFRAAPAGFAVTTLNDARFLDINEEFERIFGYQRGELIGRTVFDFDSWVNPEKRERVVNLLRGGELARDLEMQCHGKNGNPLTVRYSGQLIDIDGTACLLSAFADMTDRKRLESQLQQSQKLEALGRLAGGIAHDFNNMLAVILGRAEMAASALAATNPASESISEIRRAAERSAELTRQLLVFARRQDVAPRPLDLNLAVSESLGLLRRLIGENVVLKWNPSPGLLRVKMDPVQIDQILMNLAVNARDAIPDVGTLTISTEDGRREERRTQPGGDEGPNEWVLLTVTDTGTGMDRETLAHLFEPFFTTKEIGKGTGMGLATVYGIVQHSGGRIEAQSDLGKGTTFRIYLPKANEAVVRQGTGGP